MPETQTDTPRIHGKRFCYIVLETQFDEHGFIPSAVIEGESGHNPMMGNGEHAAPWYWGKDIATAQNICAKSNAEMGLTPDDVFEIVASSMRNRPFSERETRARRAAGMV